MRKNTIALLKRWFKIATGKNVVAIDQGVGKIWNKQELRGYYNDLTGKISEKVKVDSKGIPINVISTGESVYFPITIFQFGLGLWDKYLLTQDNKYKEWFYEIANWIVENQKDNGAWDCFSPIGHTRFTVSSMGQGEAISVLSRAYKDSNEDKYLKSLTNAMQFMFIEVKDGGVLFVKDDNYFLEEYPNIKYPKSSVLNGWIFSIFGLMDYLKIDPTNVDVQKLLNKTLKTLENELENYDSGYWTYYDQTNRLASPAYHDLHIALLKVMYELTEIEKFKIYAEKWKHYKDSSIKKSYAIIRKILQKLKDTNEGVLIE